jgi:ABC-type branched-subunit amino acid transport system substrate-binding protein
MGLMAIPYQDICAQHKKILFATNSQADDLSERVLNNYEKYKYFFSMMPNVTSGVFGCVDCILTLRNYTGFNKIAYLDQDVSTFRAMRQEVLGNLSSYGFEVVYQTSATWQTTDFTSYFAAIEESGAQILFPFIYGSACAAFVKEYSNRQSPLVIWGSLDIAQLDSFWELTNGQCEYVTSMGYPTTAGYPLTNKTLATRDAYFQRWHSAITFCGTSAYDCVRFILPDAIKRAGTTETEAVIKALEKVNVETSTARHFVFTSSHDAFIGLEGPNVPSADYLLVCLFQWQNGTQVPVYPKEILEEAGVTYKYPPWQGPWSK